MITGSDNHVPKYFPNDGWRVRSLQETYLGEIGKDKIVPNVNDWLVDYFSGEIFRVAGVSELWIPDLVPVIVRTSSDSLSRTDLLFGIGPGTQSDTYRIYLDTSVYPHTLSVDARLKVAGSMTSSCRIFLGSDTSVNGEVISRLYASNNQFISDLIPLEPVGQSDFLFGAANVLDGITGVPVNHTVKVVPTCHTTHRLDDGELVTAIIYSDTGTVVSKRQLVVENTTLIRSSQLGKKYISHISAKSAFMDPQGDDIRLPVNVPITALNIIGIVHYMDGTTLELPVNGDKFSLLGIDTVYTSVIGQTVPVVLRYRLSGNESAQGQMSYDNQAITKSLRVVVTEPDNTFAVKLMGFPVWKGLALGYDFNWYLVNLDRDPIADVTGLVRFNVVTGPFNPKAYGVLQQKQVSVNMQDVSGAYKPFIHSQLIDIVLNSPPTQGATPWVVGTATIDGTPMYGEGVSAIADLTNRSLLLSAGASTEQEWLDKLYFYCNPLRNIVHEQAVPVPTHAVARYLENTFEFPISSFNVPVILTETPLLNSNVSITFIKRTGQSDLYLGVCEMIISQ